MPDQPATPDPGDDYWTMAEIAAYWGIEYESVRKYRTRGRGELPPEDKLFGRSPVWKPATIIAHPRPGRGARTDLQKDPDDDRADRAH